MNRTITLILLLTLIQLFVSAQNYYIDSDTGNDSYNGLSPDSAWKTITKVNGVYFNPGDSILFKRGGKWTGMLNPSGSGTAENKIVFSSYGTGEDKPLIHANGNDQAVILKNMEYVIFNGFRITNPSVALDRRARGIYIFADQPKVYRDIIIRDNEIYNIIGWVKQDRRFSSGAIFTDSEGNEARFENLIIENNYIHDITTRGITGNSGASNWVDTASQHNHIIIRNNFIDNTGCDAIRPIASRNVLVEHNTIYRVGNYTMGEEALYIAACFPQQCGNTTWQFNEIAYTAPTNPSGGDMDSQAFDVDHDCVGTHKFQYNYTHDNYGGFFLIMGETIVNEEMGPVEGIIIRYNISQNDGFNVPRIFELHDFSSESLNIQVYNNVFYYTSGTMTIQVKGIFFSGIEFRNNIFIAPAGSFPSQIQFENNLYYPHTPSSQDTKAINLDPMFSDPGKGEEGLNSVYGYKLLQGSPAIGAGIIIENNGGRDFWGNLLPESVNPDIGANQLMINSVVNPNVSPEHKMDMYLYPNPFKELVTVHYFISKSTRIRIWIFDSTGRFITSLLDRYIEQGWHSTVWDGTDCSGALLTPGIYYCCVMTEYSSEIVKMSSL